MTDSPEIKRLREEAWDTELCKRTGVPPYECPVPYACENSCSTETVYLVRRDAAIQAVRDTEVRVREERAVDFRPVSIESARRGMAREVVAALRDEWHARSDSTSIVGFQVAARFIERTFLPHPDNPECDDEAVGEAIDDLGAASLRAAFDEVCDELDNPEGNG